MTDRHIAYSLVLDVTMRSDDAQPLLDLIRRLKGVYSVEPVIQDMGTEVAYERARHDLREQIGAVLYPPPL